MIKYKQLSSELGIVADILKKHHLSKLLPLIQNASLDDDDNSESENDLSTFMQFIPQQNNSLEERGIILINNSISKDSLARATQKLLSFHFDPEFTDDIQIILNSPGGYTDAGWAFIDVMDFVSNPIRTIAMGEICSMAASIFIAGDERIMAPNSQAMIHQFSWVSSGNYPDLIASRKAEDMEYHREIAHFIRHSKYKTETEIRKNILLDCDNWLTPSDMKKHGLCDHVMSPRSQSRKIKGGKQRKVSVKK